ncbi:14-3-3 protein [Histomonas meleagridis]|uniref:14-3-3 protein n=1 Tax=Histomonas meleagridis TaxID=135588 RepID=UPI0035596449|nr:14-3-3 protein [Histomonas meleagridis]KAH0804471.1 14-3-3 protein [Histomonas meleagridis]
MIASLACNQGLHEQSIKYIHKAIELSPVLDENQQNILFTPYREIAKKLRNTIKQISSVYSMKEIQTESQAVAVQILQNDLSYQLLGVCNEICAILNDRLLPNTENPVDKAVYHLVIGDFMRFVGDLVIPESTEAAETSHENYMIAKSLAETLPIAHPVRLTIDLNFSILLSDVLGRTAEAIGLAQTTYNSAISALSTLDEKQQYVSREILQLLKDNATAWASSLIA